ncbi:hypothetical protein M405DRAFT_560880 [Rhizopogon salebrosus TDB-379]|nr:hypothetical protein M405DRAFT_560880 [Rhizopogon salebrosus TDB-379]
MGAVLSINFAFDPGYFAMGIPAAQFALQMDREELQRTKSIIDSLQAEIEVQQEMRRILESRILANEVRISPASYLPTEILQRIFKACLRDNHYVEPDIRCAPLLLCYVCRRWRDVAGATPELWSSIRLNDRCIDNDFFTAMVTRWLAASHDRPLAVNLSCSASSRESLSAVFRLLVSHLAHIHDLVIKADYLYIHAFIACVCPVLKSLLLDVTHTRMLLPDPISPPPLPRSIRTSYVTCVRLRGQHALTLILPAVLPRTTHLAVSRMEEINFTKILSDFPALVKLEIKFSHRNLTLQPFPPALPTVHGALEILCICLTPDAAEFGDVANLASVFDSLSLPSLRGLFFYATYSRRQVCVERWLPDSVKALFGRSSSPTKQLLYYGFEPPQDLNGLCEQLRSVAIDLIVDKDARFYNAF